MTKMVQRDRAARFRALHRRGAPLLVLNAWDAVSARLAAAAGFPAIATTSAGMAWSLGYADGERVPVDVLVDAVARIAGAVELPVSVDVERGYGATPDEVCSVVRRLAELGAIGLNIEDGDQPPALLEAKVAALRRLADAIDVPLFVNARTDVYLRGLVPAAERVAETVRRLGRYVDAGADGVFVPGVADLAEIREIAGAVARPLNVYAGRGVPSVAALAEAGVARVSVGCGPLQAALGLTRRIAEELRDEGTWTAMTDGALGVGEVNGLFRAP